jgi:hypothetical protein
VCKRLFLLEGFEEEDDGVATETVEDVRTEDTPVFSLQALAGVAFTDTMKLEVGLGSASLVALLDSGSTHNFISEAAARRTGLPLQHRPRLMAMVANSESVACVGVIRGAPSSSAPGGSPCSARSCGISATARSPSHTRVVLSADRGCQASMRRP